MGRARGVMVEFGRRELLLGMLASFVSRVAGAGQVPVHSPDLVIKQLSGQANAALVATAGQPQLRRQEFDRLLSQGFDLERIASLVLGKHARAASPQEKEEYQQLFRTFLLEAYGTRLDQYSNHQLRVLGVRPAGPDAIVESQVDGLAGGGVVKLDWRLRQADGSWKVVDLVIEGVSMIVTQRNEFAAIIERGGGQVSALLVELRQRAKVATVN